MVNFVSHRWLPALVCAACACGVPHATGQALTPVAEVELEGDVASPDQLSGIAFYRGLAVVCPDEGVEFNVLKKVDATHYQVTAANSLLDDADAEIDLEGAASDDEYLYLTGSHSMARKKVDATRSYAKNRERILEVEPHVDSYRLFRLTLDKDGGIASKEEIRLRELLENSNLSAAFAKIPSKENGVDVEGIAVRSGRLYLGFRGPVLRDNYVPVLSFEFDDPDSIEVRFVPLGGRGIRDMTAVEDGFLILAGPVGDGDGTYELYFWNGEDCLPGAGNPGGAVAKIGVLPASPQIKPEGIAVTSSADDAWRALIVCDGAQAAAEYRLAKP